MRLIDADALMKDLEKWLKQVDPTHPQEDNAIPPMEDIIVSTLMTIAEQPTIEPERQKGEWIDLDYTEAWLYKCDQCGRRSDFKDNYCPDCGADMRGDSDD